MSSKTLARAILVFVIGALIAPVVVGVLLARTPNVTNATAYTFFQDYFRRVTQADQRQVLYQKDLTPNYQDSSHGWDSYVDFWETQKYVKVDHIHPQSGDSLEFNVLVTFQPWHGPARHSSINYWLVCDGFLPGLAARIPVLGCPVNDLAIDSGQQASVSY